MKNELIMTVFLIFLSSSYEYRFLELSARQGNLIPSTTSSISTTKSSLQSYNAPLGSTDMMPTGAASILSGTTGYSTGKSASIPSGTPTTYGSPSGKLTSYNPPAGTTDMMPTGAANMISSGSGLV